MALSQSLSIFVELVEDGEDFSLPDTRRPCVVAIESRIDAFYERVIRVPVLQAVAIDSDRVHFLYERFELLPAQHAIAVQVTRPKCVIDILYKGYLGALIIPQRLFKRAERVSFGLSVLCLPLPLISDQRSQ